MYRQLEHYRVPPEFETVPTAATPVPSEQEGAHAQPSPCQPANRSPESDVSDARAPHQGAQAAQDLPGHRRAHRRSAGLGPRVRHHRFPYSARSEIALGLGAQSLSGSAHTMSFRAFRRAVALGLAPVLTASSVRALAPHGPDTLERRAQWLHESGIFVMRFMGIGSQDHRHPAHSTACSSPTISATSTSWSSARRCRVTSSPRSQIGRWPFFGTLARAGGTHLRRSLQPRQRRGGDSSDRRAAQGPGSRAVLP